MAAIYMWPVDEQLLLTTTLYPIDVAENIICSISFSNGSMEPIPSENATLQAGELVGSYAQTRWFHEYDAGTEAVTLEAGELTGSYTQTRWFHEYDAGVEAVTLEAGELIGTYSRTKVWADSEDEELEFSVAISASNCSMTLD